MMKKNKSSSSIIYEISKVLDMKRIYVQKIIISIHQNEMLLKLKEQKVLEKKNNYEKKGRRHNYPTLVHIYSFKNLSTTSGNNQKIDKYKNFQEKIRT